MLRRFLALNSAFSATFDRLLPARLRQDGNWTFLNHVLPHAVEPGDLLYDLGGGSRPWLTPERKAELGAKVVGLDIDADELAAAPLGSYDRILAQNLCVFAGSGDADVVICQATLEHVPDTAGAIHAIASTLKPGGRAYIFAPCRNAVFARLNLILPEDLKRRLLFTLFPSTALGHDGFKAYYDRCTPRQIFTLAEANGLKVDDMKLFWMSSYFTIFTPAFMAWRLIQFMLWFILRDDAAESFIFVLYKPTT